MSRRTHDNYIDSIHQKIPLNVTQPYHNATEHHVITWGCTRRDLTSFWLFSPTRLQLHHPRLRAAVYSTHAIENCVRLSVTWTQLNLNTFRCSSVLVRSFLLSHNNSISSDFILRRCGAAVVHSKIIDTKPERIFIQIVRTRVKMIVLKCPRDSCTTNNATTEEEGKKIAGRIQKLNAHCASYSYGERF